MTDNDVEERITTLESKIERIQGSGYAMELQCPMECAPKRSAWMP